MKNLKKDEKEKDRNKKKFFNKKLYLAGLGFVLFQAVIGMIAFGGAKSYVDSQTKKQIILPDVNPDESVFEEYGKSSMLPENILATEILNDDEQKNQNIDNTTANEQDVPMALEPIADVGEPAVSIMASAQEEFKIIMPLEGEILNTFSGDKLVKSKTLGDWRVHCGIDISAKDGEEVFAAARGSVKRVYDDALSGRTVILEHESGYTTVYSGLGKNTAVNEGEEIDAGDLVGAAGNTAALEKKEAPHLHFELLKDDEELNPCDYLK